MIFGAYQEGLLWIQQSSIGSQEWFKEGLRGGDVELRGSKWVDDASQWAGRYSEVIRRRSGSGLKVIWR